MVRGGSTVRVRQRALQKRRTSAHSRSGRLAPCRTCSGYGAVYGAFAFASALRGRAFAEALAVRPLLRGDLHHHVGGNADQAAARAAEKGTGWLTSRLPSSM